LTSCYLNSREIIPMPSAMHHISAASLLGASLPYQWPGAMVKPLRAALESFWLRVTDPEAYLKLTQGFVGRPITPEERREFLARDAVADIAILTALIDRRALDNDELAGIDAPCLLYCGESDPYPLFFSLVFFFFGFSHRFNQHYRDR
jgi:hypothetical protein